MTQKEFMDLVRVFGEVKDAAKTLGELKEVISLLDEIKIILGQVERFRSLKEIVYFFEEYCWMQKEYFNVNETAVFLSLSKSAVYKLIREGELPVYKTAKLVLFKRTDLVAWIDKHRSKSQEEIDQEAADRLAILKEEQRKLRIQKRIDAIRGKRK